jgi:hypothetical protein
MHLWMHCLFWLIVPLSLNATFVPTHTFVSVDAFASIRTFGSALAESLLFSWPVLAGFRFLSACGRSDSICELAMYCCGLDCSALLWLSFLSATCFSFRFSQSTAMAVVSHLAYCLAFVSLWRNGLCLVMVAFLVLCLRPSSLD